MECYVEEIKREKPESKKKEDRKRKRDTAQEKTEIKVSRVR